MSFRTGLCISTNPKNIGTLFKQLIQKDGLDTLYVKMLGNTVTETVHSNRSEEILANQETFRRNIFDFYCRLQNSDVDVRVLLSNMKIPNLPSVVTTKQIEIVYYDSSYPSLMIEDFIKCHVANKSQNCKTVSLPVDKNDNLSSFETDVESNNFTKYDYVALGGTFDKLHIGHKILLSEAVMISRKGMTVAVAAENMLHSKILPELIDDYSIRAAIVKEFLLDLNPNLEYEVIPLYDLYGPTKTSKKFQAIVVSVETKRGAEKINEYRESNGLPKLAVEIINLIDSGRMNDFEESKFSSSNLRMRKLGTLLKPPIPQPNLPIRPYIIGFTGGIASGKSSISSHLQTLGCKYINCDKIGHQMYEVGSEGFNFIKKEFGVDVLKEDGTVNRSILSSIVFQNKEKLNTLNNGLWPLILKTLKRQIETMFRNEDVVIIEAALLIQAGWINECHEVWSCIIPPDEAVKRLQERNNLTEKEARLRIDSQPKNKDYVIHSNVVFCTLWDSSYSRQQVQKAWELLQKRLPTKQ